MNPTAPGTRHRYRTGGLVLAHKAGSEGMAAIGRLGAQKALSIYGDSTAARSLRASDLRRKRAMPPGEWERTMRSRAESFGVPLERLLPGKERNGAVHP